MASKPQPRWAKPAALSCLVNPCPLRWPLLAYLLSDYPPSGCVGKEQQCSARVSPQLHIERDLWQSGLRLVAGVDEVGMGPLCWTSCGRSGDFPSHQECDTAIPSSLPQGVRDSKMLTLKARERLDQEIRHVADWYWGWEWLRSKRSTASISIRRGSKPCGLHSSTFRLS